MQLLRRSSWAELRAAIDPVTRGWAVVTSAGVVRLGLGFVASLAVARALGPADFGVYAVLAAMVGIVGGLAEGGLTEAAVLRVSAVWPTGPEAAARRASAFFWLRLLLAGSVVAAGCSLATLVSTALLGGVDEALLRWALIGVVATATSGALSAILQATGAFGRMSSLTLINTGLTALLAVGLAGIGKLDLLSALVVLGIGTSLATFVAGYAMLVGRRWYLRMPAFSQIRAEGVQLFHTGRWLWLASLFAMLTANAEVLLLNRWIALPLLGAYALALNLASKADVVNHSLYTVLLAGVSGLGEADKRRAYLRRGLMRSAAIGLGMLLLIPLAEPFIVVVYGSEFATAVTFFRLLVGVMVFDVLLTPLLLLPLAYRQPKLLAAADAARAVTLVIVAIGLIPVFGALGAIAARFAARLAGAVVVLVGLRGLLAERHALEVQHKEAAGVFE